MLHLNSTQIQQIERLLILLDQGYFEGVKQNALTQQSDGNVEIVISLGNTMERAKNTSKVETTIVVYSSMFEEGQTRHFYATLEEALDAVQNWHNDLFGIRVSEDRTHLKLVK